MRSLQRNRASEASGDLVNDLIAFLNAQLDKDKGLATAALEEWDDESARYEWEDLPDAAFMHARWHGPARVLREVAAKRAILAEHHPRALTEGPFKGNLACVAETDWDDQYQYLAVGEWPCATVRALAAACSATVPGLPSLITTPSRYPAAPGRRTSSSARQVRERPGYAYPA